MSNSGTIPAPPSVLRVPPTNRGRKLPPEPLTSVEVEALLAATSGRTASGVRLRALIAALYGAGGWPRH